MCTKSPPVLRLTEPGTMLSIDLRWRASRPKPEFPAPDLQTESRCAQGERGVKTLQSTANKLADESTINAGEIILSQPLIQNR